MICVSLELMAVDPLLLGIRTGLVYKLPIIESPINSGFRIL